MVEHQETEQLPVGYPRRWEADVVLADGATVHVRPIRPDDADRLVAFHNRQSPESIYFRFFSPRPRLSDRDVERFTNVDYRDRMAFVGILADELIGVARYDREPGTEQAEVAFFTDDAHHGRGLATILLEYLAAVAREQGITDFTAQTLPQNRRMLGVFKQAGFSVSTRFDEGNIEVKLGLEPTLKARAAIEERERISEAKSIERLLSPRSVAVIGAGRHRGGLGHETVRNLVAGGFEGPVYPVNETANHVASMSTYPTVTAIPGEVDLAIIAVPAADVYEVVRRCVEKGVQGLIIISAGFAETGPEGAEEQRRIVELARHNGLRLIGPNCMGVINTAPRVAMRATFAPVEPEPGGVGFLSQSGTLGTAILENMGELGLAVSTFVSLGNKADVSANDLLQYWEQDDRTDVILLYMESFGNLRNFSRIARRVGRVKPIITVTSGESPIDHVPSDLPADATIDALLAQTGVIKVPTIGQLFDAARLLLTQPVPVGPRVAILSNSAGPARLAIDACRGAGLVRARLDDATEATIAEQVPMATQVINPLDLTFQADPEHFEAALRTLLADDGVDSVITIYAPPLQAQTDEVIEAIARAADGHRKPVVATILGALPYKGGPAGDLGIPVYAFPEEAARALGRVARYGEWLGQPEGSVPDLDRLDPDRANEIVERFLADDPAGGDLDHMSSSDVVACFGIDIVEERFAYSPDELVSAADELGYPVVLKATGLPRLAKTESGGLAVDLHSELELKQSYQRMVALLGDAMQPAIVQRMAAPGIDVAIRLDQSPTVGSVLSIGLGGVVLEQVGFDSLWFLPLTDHDAHRLIDGSRLGSLLGPAEREALVTLLLRVAALGEAVPEVAELMLNPVIVTAEAAAVTDSRIRLQPWAGHDLQIRRIEPD